LTATTGPALAALTCATLTDAAGTWAARRRPCGAPWRAIGTAYSTAATLTLLREATGTGVLGGIDRPPAAGKRSDDSNGGNNRTGIGHESTP
jgi:hypothetical protein